MWMTPEALAASCMVLASAPVRASGFSQITCLPALSAAMAISAWLSLGVTMSTTSMSSRLTTAAQSADDSSKPSRVAPVTARSAVTSTRTLRCGIAGAGQKNIGIAA